MIKLRVMIGFALAFLAFEAQSVATYNANTGGRVTSVLTYTYDDEILFALDPMPAGPCSTYFIIPSTVSASTRQQVLARLLLAYSTRENVNIGFDASTCEGGAGGYFRVYRVG